MKQFPATLIFFCTISLFAEENLNFPPPRRITLRHIESGGVGYNNGYTTLEAFISADPTSWRVTPFFDGRGHLFDNGTWAANGGIGLRGQLGNRIYGINAFYDYRETKHLNYNQASLGLESLGMLVDARINGYLPFSKKASAPYDTEFGYFSGHYLFLSQKVEFAMKGADAEIGFHLGNCDSWNFQGAAGPYYFRGSHGPNAWGGKVRASINYRNLVTFEAIESYDNVFHNHVQGQIAVSLPLGKKVTANQTEKLYCRQIQPVARNEIVVLNHQSQYPIAINPSTDSPYFFVFVDNTSSSEGTFESPYPSLELAQNNSLPNQIIYVFPGDGTTRNMDQGITLQPSQKFWGSGVDYDLPTDQGLITIPQLSATAPQITNLNLLGAGLALSTKNEISGITFTQTSGSAISGTDPIEVSLSSCTFTACGQGDLGIFPISLQSSSPLIATIVNSNFTENTDAGVYIKFLTGMSSAQITMNHNQARNNSANSGSVGLLHIEPHGVIGNCEVEMAYNTLQNNECGACSVADYNAPQDGSFTSFTGTFTGNTCTESANIAPIIFTANADNCTLNIQENNLSNNSQGSIYISHGLAGVQTITNGIFIIDSNQLNDGGNSGDAMAINPSGTNLSITITNNAINNNMGTGFVSYINPPYPNATLFIENNTITNNQNTNANASSSISFNGFNTLSALIEGNTLNNNASPSNTIGSQTATPGTSTVSLLNNHLSDGDTFEFYFNGTPPETGCLTITGNTSAEDPAYTFDGTGTCYIVPCNYAAENTGGFNVPSATPSADCSGADCP